MSDLRPGDVVWLRPKTLGAPAVCFARPRGTVIGRQHPYVDVQLADQWVRVHEDNVTRRAPDAPPRARPPKPAQGLTLAPGEAEVPLWT